MSTGEKLYNPDHRKLTFRKELNGSILLSSSAYWAAASSPKTSFL